ETCPVRTSENSSGIGSLLGAGLVLQQASSSLAILMDGGPSIQGGHSFLSKRPHVTTEALPLFPPV
ncbi:MAG: hypothetical protein ACJ788_17645, partial [Ktedonobacteraceae bacterium]